VRLDFSAITPMPSVIGSVVFSEPRIELTLNWPMVASVVARYRLPISMIWAGAIPWALQYAPFAFT